MSNTREMRDEQKERPQPNGGVKWSNEGIESPNSPNVEQDPNGDDYDKIDTEHNSTTKGVVVKVDSDAADEYKHSLLKYPKGRSCFTQVGLI
jgi:hypothetical protein